MIKLPQLPEEWKLRLSPLTEAALGRELVEQFLELRELTPAQLVVVSSYGEFTFDRQQRTVLRDGSFVTGFEDVQTVDVSSLPGRQDTKTWAISLYLSFFKRITIGRTGDDGDASVIAAKIGAVLGRKVLSMKLRR